MKTSVLFRSRLSVLAAAAVLLAPLVAVGQEATFQVSLSGPEVSGDPDGQAEGTVTVNPDTNQIDVRLTYSNIAEPTSIHIRDGALGTDGNIVATFNIEIEGQGMLVGRGSARPEALQPMVTSPERFYLVVLNEEHVVGALRGPLRR